MKHVVVEGPDGSGKTNLVNELLSRLGIPQHPRFVKSTGGPPADLDIRMMQDFNSPLYQRHAHLYDRHPIISEPIYGPIVRGGSDGMFKIGSWVQQYRDRLSSIAVVVFCIPPLKEVKNNVGNPDVEQMTGVAASINELYAAYHALAHRWPGALIHDYTYNTPGSTMRDLLIRRIRLLMNERTHV